jgi:hypothetical protein
MKPAEVLFAFELSYTGTRMSGEAIGKKHQAAAGTRRTSRESSVCHANTVPYLEIL